MLKLTLYTKENCSLCLKAKRILQDFQGRHAFRLIEIDITTDEDLYERYKHDIPVVTLNDEEIFRHRVEANTLEKFFNQRKSI